MREKTKNKGKRMESFSMGRGIPTLTVEEEEIRTDLNKQGKEYELKNILLFHRAESQVI